MQLSYINGTLSKKNNSKRISLFIMALPFIIIVFVFSYIPLFGWMYAFFNFKPGIPLMKSPFVGLMYFQIMMSDSDMLRVMKNTLALSFLGILSSPLPVILAIMISEVRNKSFKRIIQTMTTLPNFVSWIIVYSLFFSMFSSEGVVNQVLTGFGVISKPINVLGNYDITWYFQTAVLIWKSVGWGSIIYLAAMSSIDRELYDAVHIDGAGRFRSIIHITVPGIIPTFLVLLLLSISNIMSAGFEQYLVFYNNVIADKIDVIDLHVYRLGLITSDYSYATAVGILKSVVSIILLFIVNSISKKARGSTLI